MVNIQITLRNSDRICLPFTDAEKAMSVFDNVAQAIRDQKDMILFSNNTTITMIPKSDDICSISMKHEDLVLDNKPAEKQSADQIKDLQIEHLKTVIAIDKLRLKELKREDIYKNDTYGQDGE